VGRPRDGGGDVGETRQEGAEAIRHLEGGGAPLDVLEIDPHPPLVDPPPPHCGVHVLHVGQGADVGLHPAGHGVGLGQRGVGGELQTDGHHSPVRLRHELHAHAGHQGPGAPEEQGEDQQGPPGVAHGPGHQDVVEVFDALIEPKPPVGEPPTQPRGGAIADARRQGGHQGEGDPKG